MKQVININFQGRVVPIEVSAYEILKNYIESLNRHFAMEEGKDEIINDIENRIGELFQERIKAGATCIVDEDVHAIITSMGRPEDFDDVEPATKVENQNTNESRYQQQNSYTSASGRKKLYRDENHKLLGGVCSGIANHFDIDIVIVRIIFLILFGICFVPYIILWIVVPSSSTTVIGSRRKKLYRDTDDKYIGGVCSGIANYFGISTWIPRLLFLLPLLSIVTRRHWFGFDGDFSPAINVSPGALIIYIILWLVLPEATTTAEKLEMKGEKVDMNSIKESVVEEMKGVQERAQKFGKEFGTAVGEKGKAFGTEASTVAKKGGRSLGDIIIFLVKAFAYFIIGVVGITVVVALFGFGIAAMGVFPMKDFLLTDGWQNASAWGTLIFFILTPMIGIITWIIRRIAKIKTGSRMLRLSFISMWVIGWICVTLLGASISRDFKHSANINEQEIYLTNPSVKSLEISNLAPGSRYTHNRWFSTDPFDGIDEDTAYVRNVSVQILKSANDSFKVTMIKLANGNTRRNADTLARLINFNVSQKDSLLIIDRGIAVNKTDKFRNQKVIVTIYVPIGKKIKVNGNVGRTTNIHFGGPFGNDWESTEFENIEFENLETGWRGGTWYIMTKDGLVDLEGKPADGYKKNTDVRINANGIDVRDGKNRVRVNGEGVTVDEYGKDENGTYRYDENAPKNKFDSIKMNLQKEERRYKDSLQKEKEKIEKQLEKYDNNETTLLYNILPKDLFMTILN